jgi:hypothetical protein
MRSALEGIKVTLRERKWQKLEDLVEFAQEELDIERADRDRVFGQVMEDFLTSQLSVVEEFEEWKESKEGGED